MTDMVEQMRKVMAKCPPWVRLTKWRLTKDQALDLAVELVDISRDQTVHEVYEGLCSGQYRMFHIPVEVR